MGDNRSRRPRPPLTLRKESLRVLIPDELEQVVGGGKLKERNEVARAESRRCPW